ncbi:MAG: cell division ATP-binding protein FtsE [Ruminococcus sp.]|nr:cell division ATP-binding protein FtsE [Ruminococcus sp.]
MIEFKNVSKTYDSGTHALNNASISIEKGEFVFIVGSSGAGKSTFLKLIMHEETPSRGSIFVNGVNVTKLKRRKVPYLRRNMGIVFQDFRLIDKMTVYDNVAFAMRAIGARPSAVKKRVPYILDLVGLTHKAKNRPSELSGGEQQRVSLARALVNNPSIIIADEPTGNIDPEMSFEIIELLSKINDQGTTILIVTHEHDLVRHFNKRVVVIEKGRVVSDTKESDEDEPYELTDYSDIDASDIELETVEKIAAEVAEELAEIALDKNDDEQLYSDTDTEAASDIDE